MDHDQQQAIALHRWAVIAEATSIRLSPPERGALVRQIAGRPHAHPDGTERRYARGTIDRWIRAWRKGESTRFVRRPGPTPERCGPIPSSSPKQRRCAWSSPAARRRRSPRSSSTATASAWPSAPSASSCGAEVCTKRHWRLNPRCSAATRPNDRIPRWITDVLVGPFVPWPKVDSSVRAKLFLIVDDHSRLLVDGCFFAHENARACQDLLRRAVTHRGVPEVLYADNGAPFRNAWLTRTCAVLGVRLVHSQPYSPEGRGKQERLNRYIREAFLAEACHQGIESLGALNDLFVAWAEQVANRRRHAETHEAPICRFERGGPHPAADPEKLHEAFRWSLVRKVTRTATISLEGNSYSVDPSLVGRRIELRYDPVDLTRIDVYMEGKAAGVATPFVIGRHTHRAVPQAQPPVPEATGIDYLGMVAAAHDEQAGTGAKIDFAQLAMFAGEDAETAETTEEAR